MIELSLNSCRLDKRYDVRERLGRGSYAEIFLARDILASTQSPHSTVVIKALNVFLQDDLDPDLERTLVENFQNEAIALDRVRHPNIISRLGHGTSRDLRGTVFHYLVLEYLSGGDMQSLLRRERLRLDKALNYIEQICAGLGHAHRHSVIHRDIKPQNLLLTGDQVTLKIADFGVARVNLSDSPITRVGTNAYAPPEHSPLTTTDASAMSRPRLTPAADIYSLAKTVYAMMTGETPRAFANEPITSIPEALRDESWAGELLRVLERATQNSPGDRHQSVDEFWGDLVGIRQAAADTEYPTLTRTAVAVPQAHVARGYSPIAPDRPSFEAVAELPSALSARPVYVPPRAALDLEMKVDAPISAPDLGEQVVDRAPRTVAIKPKKRLARRAITFLFLIVGFTGILYGTASFMRGRLTLPGISAPFGARTAVASTDVYLRPSPNTENEPIGLVTKNSRVRIVNSQNNWYQVDVVQQGRERPLQAGTATRGWLNGKYIEVNN